MNINQQLKIQAMYARQAKEDSGFAPSEPEPSRVPQSPDEIEDMRKGEVREWLVAHGVEDPPAKVADMKDMLKRVMFVSE